MAKNAKEAAGGAGEEVKALAPEVLKRVEALSKLQEEFGEQHKAFVEEYKALQIKYQGVHAGLYAKRADIVSGKVDPAEAGEGKGKGIEGFWLQAMQNGRNTGGTIEEHDEPVLKALTDVRLEFAEGCDGYKISFHFAPNEYFENEVLTKTIVIPGMLGGESMGSMPSVEKLQGCDITWKAGKCLTYKEVKKTTKKKGKKVTTMKKEPQPSFFRFFETPNMEEAAELSEEEQYELSEMIDVHASVAFELQRKIIPRAVDWFTGEAAEEDSDDEDDYDEDEDDDDDEDDYDEDEDDDEDEAPKKGKGKKAAKGKKHAEDDEDDEDDDGAKEALSKALASAFAKSLAKGKGKGKKADDDEDEEEEDEEEEEAPKKGKGKKNGGGGGGGPANEEKPPECKSQ